MPQIFGYFYSKRGLPLHPPATRRTIPSAPRISANSTAPRGSGTIPIGKCPNVKTDRHGSQSPIATVGPSPLKLTFEEYISVEAAQFYITLEQQKLMLEILGDFHRPSIKMPRIDQEERRLAGFKFYQKTGLIISDYQIAILYQHAKTTMRRKLGACRYKKLDEVQTEKTLSTWPLYNSFKYYRRTLGRIRKDQLDGSGSGGSRRGRAFYVTPKSGSTVSSFAPRQLHPKVAQITVQIHGLYTTHPDNQPEFKERKPETSACSDKLV